jgi:hypothetical protein
MNFLIEKAIPEALISVIEERRISRGIQGELVTERKNNHKGTIKTQTNDSRLLDAQAKATLLVARRLNALERTMQSSSSDLWDTYVKQLDAAKNPPNAAQWQRVFREDPELEDAIAELSELLSEDVEK